MIHVDARLEGVYAKLDRAEEHLETLHGEIGDFFEARPHGTIAKFDPYRGEHIFRLNVRERAPAIRWGVLVGDFVHNARSALDHLAWQLVEHGPCGLPDKGGTRKQIRFPTETDRDQFRETVLYRRTTVAVRKALDGLQPYQRPDRLDDHRLLALDKLWNTDKHRLLHASFLFIDDTPPDIEVTTAEGSFKAETVYHAGISLEHGAEVLRLRLFPYPVATYDAAMEVHVWQEAGVKVYGNFPVNVALTERRYDMDELRAISSFVRGVIADFGPLLGPNPRPSETAH